jgi:plasmid stability protein
MSQIIVRNLDADVVDRLKERAKRHGRSLESEARTILTRSAGLNPEQAKKVAFQWHKKLAGQPFPDTTDLLRQDRGR